MPNFVKLDSKPFHPDTYVGPEHDDEDAPTESLREKSMSIKLKVENTVRWRWVKDANGQDVSSLTTLCSRCFGPHTLSTHHLFLLPHANSRVMWTRIQQRQSNSRIIRWSDGTLSLKLGKELFDITQTVDTSGAMPRQSFGGPSQSQSQGTLTPSQSTQTVANGKIAPQGLTYLVAQHKRAEILQCETVVTGYMSLRPTGMQSETHRMLVRAVGQKHSKVARLRMAPDPTMDPEREKMELLKQAAKKPRKSRGEDDGLGGMGGSGRKRRGYARKRSGDDMWSDDDDDLDGYNGNGNGGSEDEYGMDSGNRAGKKQKDENARKGPGEYQTDDFVVSDSDEDGGHDDEGGSRKKRRRRHADENEDEDEDDLDKLEAKIDQQEAEERKRKQREAASSSGGASKGGAGGDEDTDDGADAMEVESEEEEEYGVRKAGAAPGGRKKRAIEVDDEDEDE